MKKVLLVVLATILVVAMSVSSFATFAPLVVADGVGNFTDFEDPAPDKSMLGVSANQRNHPQGLSSSAYLCFRNWGTPTRTLIDPTEDSEANKKVALVVDGVEGNATQCLKVTNSFGVAPDAAFGGNTVLAADIKPVSVKGFTGIVAYSSAINTNDIATETSNYTVAAEDTYGEFAGASFGAILGRNGIGFTFLKDDSTIENAKNKVVLFVNATNASGADFAVIDLGLGDLSKKFHNYALYLDYANEVVSFVVDKKVVATFSDFGAGNWIDIKDRNGNLLTEGNDFGFPTFAGYSVVGAGCEVYLDNMYKDTFTDETLVGRHPTNCIRDDVDSNPADHKCDICGDTISECVDEDPKDHKCDVCGATLSECVDEDPMDHKCDICGATLSECAGTLVNGVAPTLEAAGYKDYYQCDCGKFYEDEECTILIENIDEWKAEGGAGYLEKLPDNRETNDTTMIVVVSALIVMSFCAYLVIKKKNIG